MAKRKGRERRRYIKRHHKQKNIEPIFNGYNLKRIKDKIIEVKCDSKLYIGKLDEYKVGVWHPNWKYTMLVVVTEDKVMNFYICNDKLCPHHGLNGLEWNKEWKGKNPPKAKINRILPKLEAMLFKIEHTL